MFELTYVRVHEPELPASLILGQTLLHEVLDNLLSNASTGTAGTEENGAVVLDGNAGGFDGIDKTANNDSAGTLDVVIEHGVGVLVALEGGEWVLEVLKLDDNTAGC